MGQLGLNFWLALTWHDRGLWQDLLFLPLLVFLFWYNGLVVSHNFAHTPYFCSGLLNRLYAILNSINIGLPYSYYYHEHLLHHRYGNDRPDQDGQTKDPTSTFACGKNGFHEPMPAYCGLGIFRADLPHSFGEIWRKGERVQLVCESLVCAGVLIWYLWTSWQFFLFLYVPTFYGGWFLEHLENYYEHFGCNPDDRFRNSTSYYGKFYNWLFCNEGYHQEHHLRPNVHWSKRPQVRMELQEQLSRKPRVILNFPPTLAWLEHDRISLHDPLYQAKSMTQIPDCPSSLP